MPRRSVRVCVRATIAGATIGLLCIPLPARAGDTWMPTSGPEGGAVLAYTSLEGVLLAGGRGGVFRSLDEGLTWSGPLPTFPRGQVVSSMCVSQGDIFAATFGAGVLRSDDLGDTWVDVSGGLPSARVTHAFADGGEVYVISDRVPMHSSNRGRDWSEIVLPFNDLATSIFADGRLLLVGSGFAVGAHRSTDGGQSWDTINVGAGFVNHVVRGPDARSLIAGTSITGVYRSEDDGLTWEPINNGLGVQPQIQALFEHGGVLFVGAQTDLHGIAMYRSVDSGGRWEWMNQGAPMDMEAYPWTFGAIGDTVLAGVEGGAWRSTDGGALWTEANRGMVTTFVRALSTAGTTLFATVTNMRRVYRSDDGGDTWTSSGEGFAHGTRTEGLLAVNEDLVFAGTDRVGAFRSDDGGQTWKKINRGLPEFNGTAGLQFRRMSHFVQLDGAIYVATGIDLEFITGQQRFENTGAGVFKTTDNGRNWQPARQGLPIITFDSFGDPKFDPVTGLGAFDGLLLAGTFRRGVFRSEDGGQSWQESNAGLPRAPVTPSVTSLVELDGEIFAGADTFGQFLPTLYRSDDGGRRWVDSSNGLPTATAVNSLAAAGCGTLYAAVNDDARSLFVSTDFGRSWQPADGGLPGRRTNVLASAPGVVYAGTAGLGVWRNGAGVACDAVKKLIARCTDNGKLTAKVKSSLPPGTTLTLTRNGEEPHAIRINGKGRGKTAWVNPSGRQQVCICECPEMCRVARCP